jgi:hypothetical protein
VSPLYVRMRCPDCLKIGRVEVVSLDREHLRQTGVATLRCDAPFKSSQGFQRICNARWEYRPKEFPGKVHEQIFKESEGEI